MGITVATKEDRWLATVRTTKFVVKIITYLNFSVWNLKPTLF